MKTPASAVEVLEARIAPATLSPAGTLLTYTDIDGDLVKITFTQAIEPIKFGFDTGSVNGDSTTPQEITFIDLTGKTGIGLTLTAAKQAGKGDSHANIEKLNGLGTDLGAIRIDGDLHEIDCGDAGHVGIGLKSLTVLSMGRADSGVADSDMADIGTLHVKGSIGNTHLIFTTAQSIVVDGSLLATGGVNSAYIQASGDVTNLKIGGSMIAADSPGQGGCVVVSGDLKTFTLGGSMLGGTVVASNTQFLVNGSLGTATIKGSLVGRAADGGGAMEVDKDLKSITIGGSVIGGTGNLSGSIVCLGTDGIGSVRIAHDLLGGESNRSVAISENGAILSEVGRIGSITIGGSFVGGYDTSGHGFTQSGMISAHTTIGAVSIGNLRGTTDRHVVIEAAGTSNVTAIASVTVKGSMTFADIFAGYERDLTAGNFDSGIGKVTVGGDFIQSRIVAGTTDGGDGTLGDGGTDNVASLIATIQSVKIAGEANARPGTNIYFNIEAPFFLKFQLGKAIYTHAELLAGFFVGSQQHVGVNSYF
ncbi:MAG: hypothetical protein QOD99_2288 [Chthoniobacter sp.]|jgi:hypothetical protein|nr:hypothetical protein [Chthoniobacter sp.]